MAPEFEEHRLDDLATDPGLDPGGALRQVASAAAQVRSARSIALESGTDRLADEGRPRSIVVVGSGAAALAGDVLAAVLGNGCPIPVLTARDQRLPGWVGGYDLVVAVAATSGHEAEPTVRAAGEAVRRGCRFLAVGVPDGPLAELAERARAPYVAVPLAGEPRAMLWSLAVPLLTAAGHAGVTAVPGEVYEAAAARLEEVAHRCGPAVETFENPAKTLAVDLASALPMVWGGSDVAALAARRFASQLAANARCPALSGRPPGIVHDQIATLDGPLGGTGPRSIFDDPVEEGAVRLRLVLLRDDQEPAETARDLAEAEQRAREHGVPVSEAAAEGGHPMERLAGLIALTDYATVYLAVAYGVEPLTNTLVVR
ncbi:glucose/mannose-6-phosphate isomerase [Spinactinospora alkalitolerans]|uniref:Glucose/mannose-6-phosphate isomerase n=1 Tax=Spinactinospora alkalitolerans TaxID=687207 RepID=A0A852U6W2_9ACTN|nr:SIS domain-containing protein [Spinactinospora alkalitolerans]NYE49660.1 glucose/mannose-6-phosphate isomerase [Spinactinospora alkalitolerans]